jgi:hypothetical protein
LTTGAAANEHDHAYDLGVSAGLAGSLPVALVADRRCSSGGADSSYDTWMSRRSPSSQIPGAVPPFAASVELVTSTMPYRHWPAQPGSPRPGGRRPPAAT